MWYIIGPVVAVILIAIVVGKWMIAYVNIYTDKHVLRGHLWGR